jgi:hypothetical protein
MEVELKAKEAGVMESWGDVDKDEELAFGDVPLQPQRRRRARSEEARVDFNKKRDP